LLIRAAILDLRDADDPDVVGQERATAGERVSTARTHQRQREDQRGSHVTMPLHRTTIETRRPFATTTFCTVFPAVCAFTAGSASASASSSDSDVAAGTVSRLRTLPFTCTGTVISSAFATSGSNDGQLTLVRPS